MHDNLNSSLDFLLTSIAPLYSGVLAQIEKGLNQNLSFGSQCLKKPPQSSERLERVHFLQVVSARPRPSDRPTDATSSK